MKQIRVLALSSPEDSIRLESILECEYVNKMALLQPVKANLERAVSLPVDALILYTRSFSGEEAAFLEALYMQRNDLVMVLMVPEASAELMARAMGCGISRVVTADMSADEICNALSTELTKLRSRKSALQIQDYDSRTLAIFGAKGGCGKTTVAVNLALALEKAGKKVCLMDFDLDYGDVGSFLNLPRSEGVSDLIGEPKLTSAVVNNYLVRYSTGISVLCAPSSPEFAELVKPEHIERLVTILRGEYDYLIFDTPANLADCTISVLEQSDVVYMVTNPEISTMRNTRVCLEVLKALDIYRKIRLILNKDGESYITARDVEGALDMKPVLTLPLDYKTCVASINRGVPLLQTAPKAKMSKDILKFAASGNV